MRKVIRTCKQCGAEYVGHKSKLYCSEACRYANPQTPWNVGMTGTKGKPRNGATLVCPICTSEFYVAGHRLGEAIYCSHACYIKSRWNESHKETRYCVICSKPFVEFRSARRVCCSKKCESLHKSRMHSGPKSHFWRGGKMAPYVGVWHERRKEALERDGYKCVLCNSQDRVQVHHIIPYRYSRSHNINNLVCLCRSCHSREELKVNPAVRAGLLTRWDADKTT